MSQPIAKLPPLGHVHASIFGNDGEKGRFLTATIHRRYMDKDEQWHSSDSYTLQDLLDLRQVVDETIDRIREVQEAKEFEEQPIAEQAKQAA